MELHPSQLQKLLTACIPATLPVLVTGAPGIGKSDIVAQAAADAGHELLISHPVVEDPTDSKGFPSRRPMALTPASCPSGIWSGP